MVCWLARRPRILECRARAVLLAAARLNMAGVHNKARQVTVPKLPMRRLHIADRKRDGSEVSLLNADATRSDTVTREPSPKSRRNSTNIHHASSDPPSANASSFNSRKASPRRGKDKAAHSTAVEKRNKAVNVLQQSFHRLQVSREAKSAPMTFRINKPGEDAGLADYGELNFIGRAAHNPAPFLRFAATREPFLSEEAYCSQVLDLLERHWKMQSASVLISITGSAQDFDLSPRLHQTFSHGLAKAAHATNAWIVTGGTDTGVMRLVGRALASFDERVTVVGITAWGSLLEREHMEGCRGQRIEITNQKKNDRFGANLEPHHTHFLMVDDGSRADKAWVRSLTPRLPLRRRTPRSPSCPRLRTASVPSPLGPEVCNALRRAHSASCEFSVVTLATLFCTSALRPLVRSVWPMRRSPDVIGLDAASKSKCALLK
eukprot:4049801-Pleurochrysis_carterae.AAC.3